MLVGFFIDFPVPMGSKVYGFNASGSGVLFAILLYQIMSGFFVLAVLGALGGLISDTYTKAN